MTLTVFDESWITKAKECPLHCWARDVMDDCDTTGRTYLDLLQRWFNDFNVENKPKQELKKRLESFNNEKHLGAVNELAWWAFMCQEGLEVTPVPTDRTPRPDFQVGKPVEFFVEVSTLNVSDGDKSALESVHKSELCESELQPKDGARLEISKPKTLKRFIGKVKDAAKQNQIFYAHGKKQSCVLVIFDYTEWSGYGIQSDKDLQDFLFGKKLGFRELPCALSALVYAKRYAIDGHIEIRPDQSTIYYNPNAKYPLNKGTFPTLNQFRANR